MGNKKFASTIIGASLLTALGVAMAAGPANAHGYVGGERIKDRGALCASGVNKNCGAVQWEPQSLEAPKGFPAAGPRDGHISSADQEKFRELDEQTSDRWAKNEITNGPLDMTWTYTAPHLTSGWTYYMTKQGWDPNAPLTRAELEPIARVDHDGSRADNNLTHTINIPQDRSGYHLILSVWDVADTANAFYSTTDVNVVPGGKQPTVELTDGATAPGAPTHLHKMRATPNAVDLMWFEPLNDDSVVGYQIFRDGVEIGTSNTTVFDDTTVTPGTTYSYTVKAVDADGNASAASNVLNVTTPAAQ